MERCWKLLRGFCNDRGQPALRYDGGRTAVVEKESDAPGLCRGIDRHQYSARYPDREDGKGSLDAIVHEDQNAIAPMYTGAGQRCGETLRRLIEFSIAYPPVATDQRRSAACVGCTCAKVGF
jgi:hypothetical protein